MQSLVLLALFAMRNCMAAAQFGRSPMYSKHTANYHSNATSISAIQHDEKALFTSSNLSLHTMLTFGICIAILMYIVFASLLKNRLMKPWIPDDRIKTYSLYLRVSHDCGLITKSIAESGLSNLSATLVAHIKAAALTSGPGAFGILDVGGVIEEGDLLVFMSEVQMLPELMRFQGLAFTNLQVRRSTLSTPH